MATTPPHWNPFAAALSARPDALRVDQRSPDGMWLHRFRAARWPAVEPAGPYAVHVAADGAFRTLALDLDADDATAAKQQLKALREILEVAGVRFVEVRSGPTGRTHLLSTWPQRPLPAAAVRQVALRLKTTAPKLDLVPLTNLATGCIRPPGAPHRHGGHAQVVGCPDQALAVLETGNDWSAWVRLCAALGVDPVGASGAPKEVSLTSLPTDRGVPRLDRAWRQPPKAMLRLLNEGDVAGAYADASAMAAAVTASLVQAGWTFPQYLQVARDRRCAGLEHLRSQRVAGGRRVPRADVDRAALRMWLASLRWVLAHPSKPAVDPSVAAALDELERAAVHFDAGGQGGRAERAALDALLALAGRVGSTSVSCSVRQLALSTGQSRTSTADAVHRLAGSGWLRITPGAGRAASTYTLALPTGAAAARPGEQVAGRTLALAPRGYGPQGRAPDGRGSVGPRLGLVYRAHDAMTRDGLGTTAGLLCDVLATGDSSSRMTVGSLIAATGLTGRTARSWLRILSAHGLVQAVAGGWRLRGDGDDRLTLLDAAARRLGASGSTARRRAEYDTESAVWAWLLADVAAERGYASLRGRRRLGYGRMRAGELAAPRRVFPRDEHGRAQFRPAMDLARAGLGLQIDELDRLDLAGHLAVGATGPLTNSALTQLELAVGIATPAASCSAVTHPAAVPQIAVTASASSPPYADGGTGQRARKPTAKNERRRPAAAQQLVLGGDVRRATAPDRAARTVLRTPASRRRTSTQPRTRTTHRVHGPGATPRGDLLA